MTAAVVGTASEVELPVHPATHTQQSAALAHTSVDLMHPPGHRASAGPYPLRTVSGARSCQLHLTGKAVAVRLAFGEATEPRRRGDPP
ncbi:hypothetical protein acdb102_35850 [Acidothermaceae bacterium B102]|nr:hypothetical protein acdb102_35850 [Acidothermaceae bacterium B102]